MGKASLHQSEGNGAQTIYDRRNVSDSTKYRSITFQLYFIFVLVMFCRVYFGFPISSVCGCVHVLSMFCLGIYLCLGDHFLKALPYVFVPSGVQVMSH